MLHPPEPVPLSNRQGEVLTLHCENQTCRHGHLYAVNELMAEHGDILIDDLRGKYYCRLCGWKDPGVNLSPAAALIGENADAFIERWNRHYGNL